MLHLCEYVLSENLSWPTTVYKLSYFNELYNLNNKATWTPTKDEEKEIGSHSPIINYVNVPYEGQMIDTLPKVTIQTIERNAR